MPNGRTNRLGRKRSPQRWFMMILNPYRFRRCNHGSTHRRRADLHDDGDRRFPHPEKRSIECSTSTFQFEGSCAECPLSTQSGHGRHSSHYPIYSSSRRARGLPWQISQYSLEVHAPRNFFIERITNQLRADLQHKLTVCVTYVLHRTHQMPFESREQCNCRQDEHHDGGCSNRATAIDGLCDGCRAAMELSANQTLSSHLSNRLAGLFGRFDTRSGPKVPLSPH